VTRVPANLFYTNSSKVDNTYAHVNKVSLPDSITEIGNDAFNNCFDLKAVIYAGSQSEWDSVTVGKNNDPLLNARFTYGQDSAVAVTSVTLSRTSLTLPVGATATLKAKVKPAKATDKTVVWSSSDPDVVTVEDGKIKAIGEGIATVTATSASDSSKSASCEITVPKPPSKVVLKKKVTLVESITAPTPAGEKIGEIGFCCGEKKIGCVDICTDSEIERIDFFEILWHIFAKSLLI